VIGGQALVPEVPGLISRGELRIVDRGLRAGDASLDCFGRAARAPLGWLFRGHASSNQQSTFVIPQSSIQSAEPPAMDRSEGVGPENPMFVLATAFGSIVISISQSLYVRYAPIAVSFLFLG